MQEVAVASNTIDAHHQLAVAAPLVTGGQRPEIAGRQRRRFQLSDLADGQCAAIQVSPAPPLGECQLAVDRRAGHAQHELPAAQQRDLRRKHRILARERLGTVDGVDQPQVLGVDVARGRFLAEEPVVRKARLQNLTDCALATYVGIRYRRVVGLDAHLQVLLVHGAGNRGRFAGCLERGAQFWRMVHSWSRMARLSYLMRPAGTPRAPSRARRHQIMAISRLFAVSMETGVSIVASE